jgi:hypothetical protein
MRRSLLVVAVLALASCSTDEPSPTAAPAATAAITASPAASFDARKTDVAALVRPFEVSRTIHADMDGDGSEEIAAWSLATEAPEGSALRQSHVDVFSFRAGRWEKVFDATKEGVLNENPNEVSQDVPYFSFIDFAGDHKPYLVLGIQNVGASNGPLDVWALRWDGSAAFEKEFTYSTDRGGTLVFGARTLTLSTGSYEPGDPGCCPSAMAEIGIGYKDGKVRILSRKETPTGNT